MGLFNHQKLNELGQKRVTAIQECFENLEVLLTQITPACREQSLMRTKLQESCFWAKKAVCELAENQAP